MTRASLLALACVVPVVLDAAVSCGGKVGETAGDGGTAGGGSGTGAGGGGPPGVDASVPPPPPFDGGVTPFDSSIPTVDASVPTPDSSLPPFDAGGVGFNGYIYFENGGFGGQPSQGSFFAEFFQGTNGVYAGCTLIGQTSSCVAYACPGSSPIDAGAPLSAGTITISGGSLPAGGVPVAGTTYSYSSAGPIYSPGQVLDIAASGGAVPAFDTSISGVGNVTLTSPQPGPNGQFTIPTNQDFVATWTGGTPSSQVWIYFESNGPAQTVAYCAFDATSGQGDVPQPVIALFKGGTGFFSPIQTNPTPLAVGTTSFTVQVATLAYDFSQATFQ